ncbi:MAG: signal peptidase II [Eubacteriales bacterium]
MDYCNSPRFILYIFIIIFILALDQIVKYIVSTHIGLNESIPIFGNFFQLTHIHNNGAAFSILQDMQIFLIATTAILCVVLCAFLILKRKVTQWPIMSGISLIIGGGLGNLIDRIRFGYVVDYLHFGMFPIFNVADMSVVGGSLLLLIYIMIIEPSIHKNGAVKNGEKII